MTTIKDASEKSLMVFTFDKLDDTSRSELSGFIQRVRDEQGNVSALVLSNDVKFTFIPELNENSCLILKTNRDKKDYEEIITTLRNKHGNFSVLITTDDLEELSDDDLEDAGFERKQKRRKPKMRHVED
jgi:hypothetical protein